MFLTYRISILLASILILSSCDESVVMNLNGQLIFSDGSGSLRSILWNSSESKTSTIYTGKEVSAIDNLTSLNTDTILFGECIVMGECFIKSHSLDSMHSNIIRTGRLPSYIQNYDKLFFYDRTSDGSNWLFMASFLDIKNPKQIAIEPNWRELPNGIKYSPVVPVIQISSEEVLFVGDNSFLSVYNILKEEFITTEIDTCRPILWRSKIKQLLCSEWDTWEVYLLDITSKRKVELPFLKGAYGFVYIPGSDALIFGRIRSSFYFGEAYDVFLFSFSEQNEMKIKNNLHLSSGFWVAH